MGRTSVFDAIRAGDKKTVEALVRKRKVKLSSARHEGKSAIAWACEAGQLDLVKELVRLGADPKGPARPGKGQSLISFAVGLVWSKDPIATCQTLADLGAPVDLADDEGATPLHVAAACGYAAGHAEEMTRWLMDRGVDVNRTKNDGTTPLHLAIAGAAVGAAKLLLAAGADVDAKTHGGATPLHACVMSFHAYIVDSEPGDPGHEESLDNAETTLGAGIDALAEAGADFSSPDGSGKTALQLAEEIDLFPAALLDLLRRHALDAR